MCVYMHMCVCVYKHVCAYVCMCACKLCKCICAYISLYTLINALGKIKGGYEKTAYSRIKLNCRKSEMSLQSSSLCYICVGVKTPDIDPVQHSTLQRALSM